MRTRIGRCAIFTSTTEAAAGRGGSGQLGDKAMDNLREFFVSSSGLAPVRQGLGLGWVISALTWVAILIGAKGASACHNNPPWTESKSSAACSTATGGIEECECRSCWLTDDCKVRCDSHWVCCVCP